MGTNIFSKMATMQKDCIWVGEDAVKYMKENYLYLNKVDVMILHTSDDQDAALAFAFELQQIWEHKAVPHLEVVTARKNAANVKSEDEGIDVIDSCNWTVEGFFPVLPTDCENCAVTVPQLKIVLMDLSNLMDIDLMEEFRGQLLMERALQIPFLTKTFLLQPDFLIRSYYLKLGVRGSNDHVLPVIPDPIKVPNFLFDHLNPIRLYKCNRWGQETPGMYNYVKEQVKNRLIGMLSQKIQKRGRECFHQKSKRKPPKDNN